MGEYLLAFDIGSTSCKTCLYTIDKTLKLLKSAVKEYPSSQTTNGRFEQAPEDWWKAMISTTKEITKEHHEARERVRGLCICAQMQSLVLVDRNLIPLRPAMTYMDKRAFLQKSALLEKGLLLIDGINLFKLSKALKINGAIAASVKDTVWKYKWVQKNEPQLFEKIHRWLDVKDYLIARASGESTMTEDSAFATFMTSQKLDHTIWSPELIKMYKVDPDHLPRIIKSTDIAGELGRKQAGELGLTPGIPIFGGGGDASMITVGANAMEKNSCYIYTGKSGWVSTTLTHQKVDIKTRNATSVGARNGFYHYFAKLEAAGKCLEWVKDHLAKDEINLYLTKKTIIDKKQSKFSNLFDFLITNIEQIPPGSGGVIFTPWLHGNRAPFKSPHARGIFFNLTLDTDKRQLIRAVVEGIIFHQKWLLESIKKSYPLSGPIGFAGAIAQSPGISQIMADIIEHPIIPLNNPQFCGAAGAALTSAIGLGYISGFRDIEDFIPKGRIYEPNLTHQKIYARQFEIFKALYHSNQKSFNKLNAI